MEHKYVIYCHTNTINGMKYIGQTCQELNKRFANGNGYRNYNLDREDELQPIFFKAILEFGWENFSTEILKDNLTENEANYWEKYYIKKYNTYYENENCNGYNMTTGGNSAKYYHRGGNKNQHHSEETKNKIRDSVKEYWKTHNRKWSEESLNKLRLAKSGANNPLSKKVMCIETGEVFDCLQQATDSVGLASKHSIRVACKNPNRTAKGFHWKYIE